MYLFLILMAPCAGGTEIALRRLPLTLSVSLPTVFSGAHPVKRKRNVGFKIPKLILLENLIWKMWFIYSGIDAWLATVF
jgi:hypothetical protein